MTKSFAPHQSRIVGDFEVTTIKTGQWRQNAYLLEHNPTRSICVIDPGGEADSILALLAEKKSSIDLILLTHAHHDHLGAVQRLVNTFNLPFYLHKGDYKLLKRVPLYAMSIEQLEMETPKGHIFIEPDLLNWPANNKISFLHLPGHTGGSVCYHWSKIAFTGDVLLNRMVGRTDLPGANPSLLAGSVDRLLAAFPDDTLLFPGHSDPWSVEEAKLWWKEVKKKPDEYRNPDENDRI
jgi:hydroxyacylglutathione hydrolase